MFCRYQHVNQLAEEGRNVILGKVVLNGDVFCFLFCHWNNFIRQTFIHILVYKITRSEVLSSIPPLPPRLIVDHMPVTTPAIPTVPTTITNAPSVSSPQLPSGIPVLMTVSSKGKSSSKMPDYSGDVLDDNKSNNSKPEVSAASSTTSEVVVDILDREDKPIAEKMLLNEHSVKQESNTEYLILGVDENEQELPIMLASPIPETMNIVRTRVEQTIDKVQMFTTPCVDQCKMAIARCCAYLCGKVCVYNEPVLDLDEDNSGESRCAKACPKAFITLLQKTALRLNRSVNLLFPLFEPVFTIFLMIVHRYLDILWSKRPSSWNRYSRLQYLMFSYTPNNYRLLQNTKLFSIRIHQNTSPTSLVRSNARWTGELGNHYLLT